MSEQNAAQVDESNLDANPDQESVETNPETQTAESAPAATEQDAIDPVQQRINKQVARTYKEKRRADDLQRQLDEASAKPAATPDKAPVLEDFDHDEEAFNAANISHQVKQAVKSESDKLKEDSANEKSELAQDEFNERIVKMNKPDFAEVAIAVPELPNGVANALVQSEMGPDLIYHLGTHLDVADKIANMTPQAAMMELGRISGTLNAKPEIKPSAAPDPIETLNSGGSISNNERGPKGATFE